MKPGVDREMKSITKLIQRIIEILFIGIVLFFLWLILPVLYLIIAIIDIDSLRIFNEEDITTEDENESS